MATATSINIYANLPKIVFMLSVEDGGPDGGTYCPHCGAEGRYIYNFVCEDGSTYGAMKGCLSKFPMHPFAKLHGEIMGKELEFRRKGWSLPRWDAQVKEAIEKYADNLLSESDVQKAINSAQAAKNAYMKRKGYRR